MKKPTLEQVKEYFKEAKTVECLFNGEKCDITKNIAEDINSEDGMSYWIDIYTHKGEGVKLWSTEKVYAKIVTKKEPTYQITKETIVKYNMKDEFPDIFEVKLEIGKWYKGNIEFESLICIQVIEKLVGYNKIYYYGFSSGIYQKKDYIAHSMHEKGLIEATPQEVETALKNEAVKRGFIEGVYCKWPNGCLIKFEFLKFKEGKLFCNEDQIIMDKNGIWAEIILTKQSRKLRSC